MAISSIETWIASTSTYELDGDGDGTSSLYDWANITNDWPLFINHARRILLSGRTSVRKTFLKQLKTVPNHADLNLSQTMDIFQLLTMTYTRYVDSGSRMAVEQLGEELVRQDEMRAHRPSGSDNVKLGVTEQIVGWISQEAHRTCKGGSAGSTAAASQYVLLSWCCSLYVACLQCDANFPKTISWKPLLEAMALLLDALLDSTTHAKPSLRNGAVVRTRRALRSTPSSLPILVSTLVSQAKTYSSPLTLVPLIGLGFDVWIRLKKQKDVESALAPSDSLKTETLNVFVNSVLMSKSTVLHHISSALDDFIRTYVTEADLQAIILPAVQKACLRSPEIALPVVSSFLNAYEGALMEADFGKVMASISTGAKSGSPLSRSSAVEAFKSLMKCKYSPADAAHAVDELLALPKAGKSSGPEHRKALYAMLAYVPPAMQVSSQLVDGLPILLKKETHDDVMLTLIASVRMHLVFLLEHGHEIPANTVNTIAKEMTSSKASLRAAMCDLAGSILWELSEKSAHSTSVTAFATAVIPVFDEQLKVVTANPLNGPVGPSEGCISFVTLFGALSRDAQYGKLVTNKFTIDTLAGTAARPFFVLMDKVYSKLATTEDQIWLLRAVQVILSRLGADLLNKDALCTQTGQVLVHLVTHSNSIEVRKQTIAMLENRNMNAPRLVNKIVHDTLSAYAARATSKATNGASADDEASQNNKQQNLAALLFTCASFDDDEDQSLKQTLVGDLILLAHNSRICGAGTQVWIDLCQRAKLDPQLLISTNEKQLLDIVLEGTLSPIPTTVQASLRAVTTLVFVAPKAVLPLLSNEITKDLQKEALQSVTDTDFAIWRTPEGTAYVNVLASKSVPASEKKGKNAAIEKWEAELRSSLASKGAATQKLSKQDIALVDAQLKKESEIRLRVSQLLARTSRGLALIRSAAQSSAPEFCAYISTFSALLLEGLVQSGHDLFGTETYDTYMALSPSCSPRLGVFQALIGVATLRSINDNVVPEEYKVEGLNSLALRVLHRVRSLAEQEAFDGATFSYLSPLLSKVVETGGLNLTEEDDPVEQLALVVEIYKLHGGEFSDDIFPRKKALENLILVIKNHPQLGQDAASVLLAVAEAIHTNAASEEINVLIQNTLASEVYVRNSCLQSLQPLDLTDLDWSPELWIACHDTDEPNSRLARRLWEDNGLDVPERFVQSLSSYLAHDNMYVRSSCAESFFEATDHWPNTFGSVWATVQDVYREKAQLLAPEFDQYGLLVTQSLDRSDPWPTRLATAQALKALAPLLPESQIEPFFDFLIGEEVLGDRHGDVRRAMLEAGSLVMDLHGAKRLRDLITMFERYLASPGPASDTGDYVKEGVVILFGRVARHMDANDSRIPAVIDRLVDALKTPSEQVQVAVSDCLAPVIVKLPKSSVANVVDKLMSSLFDAQKYAERRGAAYGLAGVVKGVGIAALTDLSIIDRFRTALEDKKRFEPRQGAMFAFETLSATIGRNFEPFIIQLLPLLLASFGDAVPDVREATQDAAKVIMGNLSGYGVKQILPSLLAGLDEKQWRTKKGSIELLGTMAFCAPKQLSISLPTIIPHLTGVLTDSHAQVRSSASKSLKQFGEVINNPELQVLVPVLLKALVDPARVSNALASILKASFTHYIDSPSLALVIPIIDRGLRDRSAEVKRKAAQIVGNLASLTDSQDFIPYLNRMLPLVHIVLVDPVPEARATAAKTLGTLVERMGEEHFPDMVPGLLRTLKTDTSRVDRQGAAQGLSEVLVGLGMERLEALLPDIVSNAQSPRSTVREGFMSLLVFLPATFGSRFQPHLLKIVPAILAGLSDTEEFVREAAMRAGRMIINNYASKAVDLLLPELERGMFDRTWRIRHSSVTLVGELLFKFSGITGKAELEDDEEADVTAVETYRRALVEVLGKERRDRILSSLYIVRHDSVIAVRQAAMHIWKVLVHNTPRTVRELLPSLVDSLVFLLTERDAEPQETATRTIGELCRKFGEKIIGEIITLLRSHAQSSDSRTREGVCFALSEIMENATETQREDHNDDIVAVVRSSLVDDEPNVRAAAARAFNVLQEHLGASAINQTIPTLLEALRQPGPGSATALQALKEVMNVQANTVFPVLIPTLIASPISIFNARALASLVTVAGNALSKRLSTILTALVNASETSKDEELSEAVAEAIKTLLSSIADSEGLNTLMLVLLEWSKSDRVRQRVNACNLFALFCEESDLDDSLYRVDWTRQLVTLLDDRVEEVHTAALKAFDSFVKSIPKDEMESLVIPLRRTIDGCGSIGHHVPGFSLPKGIAPMVPIIISGLTTGNHEQRENAAYAIGDLVERTEENAMKPFVVAFTGPLIRVATQATAYPPGVKSAILSALTTMLDRIPTSVKPFFPQLQRTFVKSASDPSSLAVRNKAATALGTLMRSQPRVDPVVTELIGGAKSSEDVIAASLVLALSQVVRSAGANLGDKARELCVELVLDAFKEAHDEPYVQATGSLFASLANNGSPALLQPIVKSYLLAGTPLTPLSSHCILAVLSDDDLQDNPNLFQQLGVLSSVATKIKESVATERPSIARPAREAKELIASLLD